MATQKFKSKQELEGSIKTYKMLGIEVPKEILEQYDQLCNESKGTGQLILSDTPIYDTLVANYPYGKMPEEKIKCIEDTVTQLLQDDERANEPGLLLGKIQCGKTDTFEDIIGLAFDKGIDIAIVLTKGTKPLAQQTLMRMKKDYRFFKASDNLEQRVTINIYDIMTVWNNLKQARVEGCKTVFVCKKQSTNLSHLIDMFSIKSPFLKKKKVLIVDDEADFASRNYRSVKAQRTKDEEGNIIVNSTETEMAKISQQIDDFRKIPEYCRYLQVTATPYCLYLQPQGELNLKGDDDKANYAMPFRPRFTTIVPVHEAYVGGKQYFEDSQNPDSMYSHLFHQIEQKCIDVLGHEDKRYLNNSVSSANIYGLTYAMVSYFMATAIRRIQARVNNRRYQTSALIHVELDKKNHDWQSRVINRLINSIKETIVEDDQSDQRIWTAIESNYNDFLESNRKGCNEGLISIELPSKDDIIQEIRNIFIDQEYNIQIVNSDKQVESLLDEESGELKLETAANIFIGGNILDRGITIKNMLCFFYGRNPKKFQQDTVLQHARMYGARSKEDMAVTRLHTTSAIYGILSRMNDLDNQLREWFLAGNDNDNLNAIFVGYDKNIKPCATQKIKVSNIHTIKQHKRLLPVGFWTGSNAAINSTILHIDSIIESSDNYNSQDENGFFEMDFDTVRSILELINSTYVYKDNDKIHNLDHKDDVTEMICTLRYCTSNNGGKVYVVHRTNRNMNRLRTNGGYIDAPDDGRTDTAPSKTKAVDAPVVMFIRQNGKKYIDPNTNENIGWNNTPFYWPVLVTQQKLSPTMFALGLPTKKTKETEQHNILDGINENEVLKLTFTGDLEQAFGKEGVEYTIHDCPTETRSIKETVASKYLEKDENGKWEIAPEISFEDDHGIYSYNKGYFPFVFRDYKYMLLRNGRDANADEMLLELFPRDNWELACNDVNEEDGNLYDRETGNLLVRGTDTIIGKDLSEKDYSDNSLVQWIILYKIKKVLRYIPSERHKTTSHRTNSNNTETNNTNVKSSNQNYNSQKYPQEEFGKTLNIRCRQNHLDLVVSGDIYIETISIDESNIDKYIEFGSNGDAIIDNFGEYIPIKYDVIKLSTSKTKYAIIQIKKIAIAHNSIYYTYGKVLKDNSLGNS